MDAGPLDQQGLEDEDEDGDRRRQEREEEHVGRRSQGRLDPESGDARRGGVDLLRADR
jgi:hypothetical protein